MSPSVNWRHKFFAAVWIIYYAIGPLHGKYMPESLHWLWNMYFSFYLFPILFAVVCFFYAPKTESTIGRMMGPIAAIPILVAVSFLTSGLQNISWFAAYYFQPLLVFLVAAAVCWGILKKKSSPTR
jgi:hypothetical protein